MSTIDQVVQVSILAAVGTPSLPGVDTPALIGYHTHYADRIRTYFDVTDMVTDGFSTTEPLYLAALALVSQNPRPSKFKVIKASNGIAQTMDFKVTDTQTGHVVGLVFTKPDGTTVNFQHTNTVGQTAAQIATALQALVIAGLTLTIDGGDNTEVEIAVNAAGDIWYPSAIFGGEFHDITLTAAPGTDLDAAVLIDPDFYGVSGVWMSDANIQAIAVWTEANKRLHSYTTPNTDNVNTNNLGIFQTLKAASYNRSVGWFSGTPRQYLGVAIMSQRLTADPGSDTWFGKTLEGVTVDNLTPTQITNAGQFVDPPTKNGNVYIPVAGLNATIDGRGASGQYADITRGLDALSRDIQTREFGLMTRIPRVPFTRKGIGMMLGELKASLQSFVTDGFLSDDDGLQFTVSAPDITTISASDKSKRKLKKLKFHATAQGAIQSVTVEGSVSF